MHGWCNWTATPALGCKPENTLGKLPCFDNIHDQLCSKLQHHYLVSWGKCQMTKSLKLTWKCAYCDKLSHLPLNITTIFYILSTGSFLCVILLCLTPQNQRNYFVYLTFLHKKCSMTIQLLRSDSDLSRFIEADHLSMRMISFESHMVRRTRAARWDSVTAQINFSLLEICR